MLPDQERADGRPCNTAPRSFRRLLTVRSEMGTCLTSRSLCCSYTLVWKRSRSTARRRNLSSLSDFALGEPDHVATVATSLPEPKKDSADRRLVYPELLSHLSLRMACFRQCHNSYGTFLCSDDVSFHCGSLCPATTYGIG